MVRAWIIACALAALTACAPLTAEAPLFSVRDQIGPAPLSEGIWISIDDSCPARMAQRRGRLPKACSAVRISHLPDGSWQIAPLEPRHDDDSAQSDQPFRFVIAPAVEHPGVDAYAPLYLVEAFQIGAKDQQHPNYGVLAPINTLPATDMYFMIIECGDILRDGPVAGITPTYDAPDPTLPGQSPAIKSCVAVNQAAVREAARREVIESLSHLESSHLMFVRP